MERASGVEARSIIFGVDRGYRTATQALSAVTAILGVLILAITIARGGGPLARGIVIGVALIALGAGRFYFAARRARPPRSRQ